MNFDFEITSERQFDRTEYLISTQDSESVVVNVNIVNGEDYNLDGFKPTLIIQAGGGIKIITGTFTSSQITYKLYNGLFNADERCYGDVMIEKGDVRLDLGGFCFFSRVSPLDGSLDEITEHYHKYFSDELEKAMADFKQSYEDALKNMPTDTNNLATVNYVSERLETKQDKFQATDNVRTIDGFDDLPSYISGTGEHRVDVINGKSTFIYRPENSDAIFKKYNGDVQATNSNGNPINGLWVPDTWHQTEGTIYL